MNNENNDQISLVVGNACESNKKNINVKKEEKNEARIRHADSILAFEVKLGDSASRGDLSTLTKDFIQNQQIISNTELNYYWLLWPLAFFTCTTFCIVTILCIPIASPSLGLDSNLVYLFIHVGFLQMVLFTSLQLIGKTIFSSFFGMEYAELYSPRRIIIRNIACATISVAAYYIVSKIVNVFPLPLGFCFSIGGMIIEPLLEVLVVYFMYHCCGCCRSNIYHNHNDDVASTTKLRLGEASSVRYLNMSQNMKNLFNMVKTLLIYTIGWAFAIVLLNLYSNFDTYAQYIFICFLVVWKTALPVFVPYFIKKVIKFENSSSVLEGFLASSIHMYWTLIGTLCFTAMKPSVFVWYLILDIVSGISTSIKGSRRYSMLKQYAILRVSNMYCCGCISPDSEIEIMHERAYYTAVFMINTLGEILIPLCVAAIYNFATLTANYSHNKNFFNFFTYCLIMIVSDSLLLFLAWIMYKKYYGRNLFHPVSYAIKKEIWIPFTLTFSFMLPVLMMLPEHSGIKIE